MCDFPRIYTNKKYLPNKKNNYNPPIPKDLRVLAVPTKCNECITCMKAKQREWRIRLKEELRTKRNGKFVTLTFSNEEISKLYQHKDFTELKGYELDYAVARLAKDRFKERWRKEHGKYPWYWLITELGGRNTENLHFHGIIWTDNKIEKIWKYGGVYIGKYRERNSREQYVNERTINYVTKYVIKRDPKHKYYKSQIFANDGMGKGYMERESAKLNKYKGIKTKETYTDRNGFESAIPIYYRNKIYNDDEKEQLWIHKLDSKTRWIHGKKIDVSKDEKELLRAIHAAQELSKKRGYGNGQKEWKEEQYERELRMTKIQERINAATKIKGNSKGQITPNYAYA